MTEEIFISKLFRNKQETANHFPDKQLAEQFAHELFQFLFIEQDETIELFQTFSNKFYQLKKKFEDALSRIADNKQKLKEHSKQFFDQLPIIYSELFHDASAILEFDPAAQNLAEVIIAYPGFYATAIYRFSNQLWSQGLTVLARLFSEYAHGKTGIDIHPAASIGKSFAIDHGTGIVIGETTVIGDHVKIYQGVTLGALNVSKENATLKRHPTIEDEVIIYSGATILGGDTVIGKRSIIGGNVWITSTVPANSVVYHKSEIKIKDKDPFPEPFNFII